MKLGIVGSNLSAGTGFIDLMNIHSEAHGFGDLVITNPFLGVAEEQALPFKITSSNHNYSPTWSYVDSTMKQIKITPSTIDDGYYGAADFTIYSYFTDGSVAGKYKVKYGHFE